MIPISVPPESARFIPIDEKEFINTSYIIKCGVYESFGVWWIYFDLIGEGSKYYMTTFQNREMALKALRTILEPQKTIAQSQKNVPMVKVKKK